LGCQYGIKPKRKNQYPKKTTTGVECVLNRKDEQRLGSGEMLLALLGRRTVTTAPVAVVLYEAAPLFAQNTHGTVEGSGCPEIISDWQVVAPAGHKQGTDWNQHRDIVENN